MNDRELLELAAKAAGIELVELDECQDVLPDGTEWDPLANDGDALRLAVRLHIDILHRFVGGQRVEALAPGGPLISRSCDERSRQDATRRAIVRAAAEIGKAMP